MPVRNLKPSICTSESMAALSWFAQVLFIRLIPTVDDFGRYDGRAQILRGHLFPLELDRMTEADIEGALVELEAQGMLRRYITDGRVYLELVSWRQHQQVRAAASKYPDPPTDAGESAQSASICQHLPADASKCDQVLADSPVNVNRLTINDHQQHTRARARARELPDADRFAELGNAARASVIRAELEAAGGAVDSALVAAHLEIADAFGPALWHAGYVALLEVGGAVGVAHLAVRAAFDWCGMTLTLGNLEAHLETIERVGLSAWLTGFRAARRNGKQGFVNYVARCAYNAQQAELAAGQKRQQGGKTNGRTTTAKRVATRERDAAEALRRAEAAYERNLAALSPEDRAELEAELAADDAASPL